MSIIFLHQRWIQERLLFLIWFSPEEIWEPLHLVSYAFPEWNFPFKYMNRDIIFDHFPTVIFIYWYKNHSGRMSRNDACGSYT